MTNVVPFGGNDPPPPDDAPPPDPQGGEGRKKKEPDWAHYNNLLERFALIYSTDTVWDESTGLIMKISAMAHAHGADYVRMWKNRPASHLRSESLSKEDRRRWTVHPDAVVFDPTMTCDPETTINLYSGLQMTPVEGNVEPLLELARYLTSRASDKPEECEAVLHWLLCWLAYPLQRPGAKLRCAVVMHGDEGAGKNIFFETMLEIYGEYGKAVGQDELEDKFNDWRSRTLFVVADEASSRQELVHNKNRLKALITSPTVQINPKNLPRREESNHMNIVFLSNELTPLALDNTDRRYLVVFTPPTREPEYYKAIARWRAWGGAAAFMAYLKRYDISSFDPFAPPPITAAKLDLIDLNRKTPERFWIEWSAGELALPYVSCSVDQAYRAYNRYSQRVGDRYPVQKQLFSRMVARVSESLKRPLRIKTMRVSDDEVDRATRMMLVTEPKILPGVTEGSWATACVEAFERQLRRYLHNPHSPEGAEMGETA
jgi:putative DNA primase/helicase